MQQPHFAGQVTQAYNVYVNPYGMRRLAPHFQPGSYDVLCARGKVAYDHDGNRRFRELVKRHQKQYSAASCKYEKSKIVSFIVSAVRNASPHGGFVKNIDGAWYEVGDRHAKEKVGQTFRDLLHTKYSSSTKAKARARLEKRVKGESDQKDADQPEPKRQKKEPDSVPSRHPISRADDVRSSVSVVSENSMETDEIDNTTGNRGKDMPPLTSVVVANKRQQQRQGSQVVSPAQSERVFSSSERMFSVNLMRSSIHTFDGRDSTTSTRAPLLQHPGAAYSSSATRPQPMELNATDLEPLPLGQAPAVKVDFNESTSSMQSEQSFEDVMSEFCQNMHVAV